MYSTNIFFLVICLLFLEINCSEWDYKHHGPDTWPHDYPTCNGALQSPINLEKSISIFNNALKPIVFENYDLLLKWKFENNGQTIVVSPVSANSDLVPSIYGSDYREKFYLSQFHFHWGMNSYQGSEHHLNGEKFPLEIHLVHKSQSNRLAVIGFIFQISRVSNKRLNPMLNAIGNMLFENDSGEASLRLSSFLPNFEEANRIGYFRYLGSLTTPPCTEGVIWTVYEAKIPISEDQMNAFYSNKVELNFREPQNLNDRKLFFSRPLM